jgi:uncharacterized protein with PIN domain
LNVNHAYIQFNGDLKDFLTSNNEVISVDFKGRQSVKHIIESLGVPHPEVHKIFVNKQLTSFSYILEDKDFVEVFPWQTGDDFLLNYPLEIRFILDSHLGKLATYLRILGIDTLYQNDYQDDEIVRSIKNDQRILLTRDRRLLMRREIHWGYCVRQDNPLKQLIEVIDRFNLGDQIKPLNRCLRCNHEINPIDKLAIIHRLEPLTKLYYEEFYYCPRCDQIYWKGSHYEHMLSLIRQFS